MSDQDHLGGSRQMTLDTAPTTSGAPSLADRLDALVAEQERIFLQRQPRSREMLERGKRSLAGGVTSSWQIARPQAVFISRGQGSKMWDVDGTEYVDMHGG